MEFTKIDLTNCQGESFFLGNQFKNIYELYDLIEDSTSVEQICKAINSRKINTTITEASLDRFKPGQYIRLKLNQGNNLYYLIIKLEER